MMVVQINKQQSIFYRSEFNSVFNLSWQQIWLSIAWSLFISTTVSLPAYSQSSGGGISGLTGSAAGVQAQYTPWQIRKDFLDEKQDVKPYAQAQQESKTGPGGVKDSAGAPIEKTFSRIFPSPTPVPSQISISSTNLGSPFIKTGMKKLSFSQPEGPETADQALSIRLATDQLKSDYEADPDRYTKPALAAASAMSTSAANSMAGAAVSQATGAIEFTRHYLVNFTAQAGSSWQSLRNNIFIPIAILLLLPGAVLAQVRAIVAQGSPILGEINPFEGITRSVIAIFMIPASFLVVNYGIDVANSLTYSISTEYWKLFGTDMYQDAECAEMRAFPVNGPGQNMNAFLPIPFSLPPIMKDPWSMFESTGVANKLFDPCAGLNISNVADEQSSSTMSTDRMMMNGSNSFLAMTWNIMCAFQTVFLYYLWCMGPIVAALWVWPMERLRSALPSWIEGVITLCFWSLFWNVVVLLMACFRGVSETGTVIMTALNGLATISVWYAFDFSALVSEGAGYSMMNAISSSMKSHAGGGGGGGGGGAQKSAGGGQAAQAAGGGGLAMHSGAGGVMAGQPGAGLAGAGVGGMAGSGALAFSGGMGGSGSSIHGASGLLPGGVGGIPMMTTSSIGGTAGDISGAGGSLGAPPLGSGTFGGVNVGLNGMPGAKDGAYGPMAAGIAGAGGPLDGSGASRMSALDRALGQEMQNRGMSPDGITNNMTQQQMADARMRDMQTFAQQQGQEQAQQQAQTQAQQQAQQVQQLMQQQGQELTQQQAQQQAQQMQQLTQQQQGASLADYVRDRGGEQGNAFLNQLNPETQALFQTTNMAGLMRDASPDTQGNLANLLNTGLPAASGVDLPPPALGSIPALSNFTANVAGGDSQGFIPSTGLDLGRSNLPGLPPLSPSGTGFSPPDIIIPVAGAGNFAGNVPTPDLARPNLSNINSPIPGNIPIINVPVASSNNPVSTGFVEGATVSSSPTNVSSAYPSTGYSAGSQSSPDVYPSSPVIGRDSVASGYVQSTVSQSTPDYSAANVSAQQAAYTDVNYNQQTPAVVYQQTNPDPATYVQPSQQTTYTDASYVQQAPEYVYQTQPASSSESIAPANPRTEQVVDWSAASNNNMSRDYVAEQASAAQPVFVPQTQAAPADYVMQNNTQPSPDPYIVPQIVQQSAVPYMPIVETISTSSVRQTQPIEQQSIVVNKQQTPPSSPPTVSRVQKQVNIPVPISPPAVPRSNISSVLSGMQPGAKASEKSNTTQPNGSMGAGVGSLGRGSVEGSVTQKESLGEHLARLNRGGGRTAPKAKDIYDQNDLPPEIEEDADKPDKKD